MDMIVNIIDAGIVKNEIRDIHSNIDFNFALFIFHVPYSENPNKKILIPKTFSAISSIFSPFVSVENINNFRYD